MPEKRKIERFDLKLPVSIKMKGSQVENSYTKDISSMGVFVQTTNPLETGSQVDLAVKLPFKIDKKECRENIIKVSGKVIRIDTDGMAILFDREGDICPQAFSTEH